MSPSLSPPPSILSITQRGGPESLRPSLFICIISAKPPIPQHRLRGIREPVIRGPWPSSPSPGRQSPSCLSELVPKGSVASPFGCAWSRKLTNSKLCSQSKPPQPKFCSPHPSDELLGAAKREALKTSLCPSCESTNVCCVCPAEREHISSLPNAHSKDAPQVFLQTFHRKHK